MEHGTTSSKKTCEGWVTYACGSLFKWRTSGRGTYGTIGTVHDKALNLPEEMSYWPETIEVTHPHTNATQIFKLGSIDEKVRGKYMVAFYRSKEGHRLEVFTLMT